MISRPHPQLSRTLIRSPRAARPQAELYGTLCREVLDRRRRGDHDAASLDLSAKLLELNPEVYSVWNYRREALAPALDAGGDAAVAAAARELELSERALSRNPKSYAAWHHRAWIVRRRLCSLERELELVALLLDVDERNFHAWAHRRLVSQVQRAWLPAWLPAWLGCLPGCLAWLPILQRPAPVQGSAKAAAT